MVFMEENLFRYLDIPAANIHIPDGLSKDLAKNCTDYEAAIRAVGGLDLQILGIGRTGHIGFNEPPSAVDTRTRWVHLDEVTRRDNSAFFGDIALVPHGALTMGVATILEARRVELIAFGEAKADVIRRAIQETPSAHCPATWLQKHPHCTFHLDAAAAKAL
jgi:glucosamine-6-phosphate deaminase